MFPYEPGEIVDRATSIMGSYEEIYGQPLHPAVGLSMALSPDLNTKAVGPAFWPSTASMGRQSLFQGAQATASMSGESGVPWDNTAVQQTHAADERLGRPWYTAPLDWIDNVRYGDDQAAGDSRATDVLNKFYVTREAKRELARVTVRLSDTGDGAAEALYQGSDSPLARSGVTLDSKDDRTVFHELAHAWWQRRVANTSGLTEDDAGNRFLQAFEAAKRQTVPGSDSAGMFQALEADVTRRVGDNRRSGIEMFAYTAAAFGRAPGQMPPALRPWFQGLLDFNYDKANSEQELQIKSDYPTGDGGGGGGVDDNANFAQAVLDDSVQTFSREAKGIADFAWSIIEHWPKAGIGIANTALDIWEWGENPDNPNIIRAQAGKVDAKGNLVAAPDKPLDPTQQKISNYVDEASQPGATATNVGLVGLDIASAGVGSLAAKGVPWAKGVMAAGGLAIGTAVGADLVTQYNNNELGAEDIPQAAIALLATVSSAAEAKSLIAGIKNPLLRETAGALTVKLVDETGGIRLPGGKVEPPTPAVGPTSRAKHYESSLQGMIDDIEQSPAYKEELLGRGGGVVISNRQTYADALAAGPMDESQLINWQAETPINTVDVVRAKATMNSVSRELVDAWKIGDDKLASELTAKATQMEAGYQMATATPGRALQAQSTFVDRAAGIQAEIADTFKNNKGPLTDGQKTFIQKKIAELEEQAAKQPNNEQAFSWVKAVEEYATAAKLTSPFTHLVNTVSNSLAFVQRGAEKVVSAGIGTVKGETSMGEIKGAFGTRAGWKQAGQRFIEAIKDEKAFSKDTPKGMIPGKAGRVVRTPFRLLGAADEFSSTVLRDSETYARAYEQAWQEGARGATLKSRIAQIAANPPEKIAVAAEKAALENTYRDEPWEAIKALAGVINKMPGGKLIVPFITTPANITRFYVRRSPLGLASPEMRRAIKAGGTAQREALGKLGVGIGLSISAYALVEELEADGRITGDVPTDPGEREAFYAQGKKPRSIEIGGKWYDFARIQPVGLYFVAAKALHDAVKTGDEQGVGEALAASATTMAKGISDQPWLSGVSSALDALNDPERSGAKWAQSVAGGFVPTGMSDIARYYDGTMRRPQTIAETVKSRIPGLSKTVQPRVDMFGEQVQQEKNPWVRTLLKMTSTGKRNAVAEEMDKLGYWPQPPDRKDIGIKVSDADWVTFQEQAGQGLTQEMTKLIGSDKYKSASKLDKELMIQGIATRSRQQAKANVLSKNMPVAKTIFDVQKEWDEDLRDASSYEKLAARPLWRKSIRPALLDMAAQKDIDAAKGWQAFLALWDERNEDIGAELSPDSKQFPKDLWNREFGRIAEAHPAFLEQFEALPKKYILR